jgi:predicted metal-binding protein
MPWKKISKKNIIFDPKVQSYCKNPDFICPNYGHNWACPPEAPYLEEEILQNYQEFYLIYVKTEITERGAMDRKPKDSNSGTGTKVINSLQNYNRMRDWIEEEITEFIESYSEEYTDLRILWYGHCRVCEKRREKCTYDDDIPCRYPDEKRYSMEAVGIDVTETVENVDLDIEWPPKNHIYRFALICIN